MSNIFDDLEQYFTITNDVNDDFRLVTEDELPEDYQQPQFSEEDVLSNLSASDSLEASSIRQDIGSELHKS